MPDNTYSVEVEFIGGVNGWKVGWYGEAASADECLDDFFGEKEEEYTSDVIVALKALISERTRISDIVAKNIDGKRKDARRRTLLLKGGVKDDSVTATVDEGEPAYPGTTAFIRGYGAGGGDRMFEIGGLAKADVKFGADGLSAPTANYVTRCNTFIEKLAGAGALIKTTADEVPSTKTGQWFVSKIYPVSSLNPNWSEIEYLSEEAEPTFVQNDFVTFLGRNTKDIRLDPYAGKHRVIYSDLKPELAAGHHTVVIAAQYVSPLDSFIPIGMTMRGVLPEYTQLLASGDFVKFAQRDRGAVRTTRGRAPSRSRRQAVS